MAWPAFLTLFLLQDGVAPSHLACQKGNDAALQLLLERGADPNLQELARAGLLSHSLFSGTLLNTPPALQVYGLTPLHVAATYPTRGSARCADALLRQGASTALRTKVCPVRFLPLSYRPAAIPPSLLPPPPASPPSLLSAGGVRSRAGVGGVLQGARVPDGRGHAAPLRRDARQPLGGRCPRPRRRGCARDQQGAARCSLARWQQRKRARCIPFRQRGGLAPALITRSCIRRSLSCSLVKNLCVFRCARTPPRFFASRPPGHTPNAGPQDTSPLIQHLAAAEAVALRRHAIRARPLRPAGQHAQGSALRWSGPQRAAHRGAGGGSARARRAMLRQLSLARSRDSLSAALQLRLTLAEPSPLSAAALFSDPRRNPATRTGGPRSTTR